LLACLLSAAGAQLSGAATTAVMGQNAISLAEAAAVLTAAGPTSWIAGPQQ